MKPGRAEGGEGSESEDDDQQAREWAKVAYDQMVLGAGYYLRLPDGGIKHVPVEELSASSWLA
jgi:hypothetical protein